MMGIYTMRPRLPAPSTKLDVKSLKGF